MGRRKDETEAQYQKRLRYVRKEQWFFDNVWPWIVVGGILLFFGYFIFFYEEYVDPRYPPDPPKPYYQGR